MSTLASNFPLPSPFPFRPSRWGLIRAWLPTFVWLGIIACESTSMFTSAHTQGWVFQVLRHISGWLAVHAGIINEVGRKVGHFVGYGSLALSAFFGWTELLAYRRENYLAALGKPARVAREWQLRAAELAVFVTFAVASLDEFHQSFVPGRGPSFRDVLLDTCGGIVAQALIFLVWKSRTKTRTPVRSLEGELAPEV
jgi:VanZ family protein